MLADGCFDPLHAGHLAYLEAAARLGDELIVRVAYDGDIEAKGRKPFQSLHERRDLVGALRCVDGISYADSLAAAIATFKPSVLAKGVEWAGKLPAEVVRACQDCGTAIVYTDTQSRTSTERLNDGR